MRTIDKPLLWGLVGIIATIAIGGAAVIATISRIWALWGGIGLLILAGLLMIALVVMLITKRGIIMKKDNEKTNIIKDSKFKAKIEKADKATVMDINSPTITENVEASLEAKDVRDATVIRTNQTLNIRMGECETCHRPLPSVSFGVRPSSITCRFCGHENNVNDDG